MAKMFYTLEEAAEALGKSEDEVKEMANEGTLKQFRDRDKLMFKREQVDAVAGGGETSDDSGIELETDDDDAIDLDIDEGGDIPLADDDIGLSETGAAFDLDEEPVEAEASGTLPGADLALDDDDADAGDEDISGGDGDAIDLEADDIEVAETVSQEDEKQRTGVSVFDADEVETADPSAATQVTSPAIDEEELALESVASGSGLLDLTRESDDTSLGAELLDEIYPGGESDETGSDTGLSDSGLDAPAGASTSVFDEGLDFEASASGLENLSAQPAASGGGGGGGGGGGPAMVGVAEAYDPAGSLFGGFTLIGATAILVVGMIIGVSVLVDAPSNVTRQLADLGQNAVNAGLAYGGMFVASVILGVIGYVIGRKLA